MRDPYPCRIDSGLLSIGRTRRSRWRCGWTRGKYGTISPFIVDGCGYLQWAIHRLHRVSTKLSTSCVDTAQAIHSHPHASTTSQQTCPHRRRRRVIATWKSLHAIPTAYPRHALFVHTIIHRLLGMYEVVGRVARAPTYAHKGRVVHKSRPVIHADKEWSRPLQNRRCDGDARKNRALSAGVGLSTLIVDNFASCG